MNALCGLCAQFYATNPKRTRYFFTQAQEENYSAVFKWCIAIAELVHESFVGCEFFEPTKSFYCARYESTVNTEVCLKKQLREVDESCLDCIQGQIVIDVMRGVEWSELK